MSSSTSASLGGDVKLKFLELGNIGGRGGALRFMLLANEIDFEDIKIPRGAAMRQLKQELIASGDNPSGRVPVLYIDNKPYVGHLPVIRYIAAKTQAMSTDPELRYKSDVILDEYTSWRDEWVAGFNDLEKRKANTEKRGIRYELMEKLYDWRADKTTPFFQGKEKPGYEDVCVFALIYDELQLHGDLDLAKYPVLKELYEKVGQLPRVAEWTKEAVTKPLPSHIIP